MRESIKFSTALQILTIKLSINHKQFRMVKIIFGNI